MGVITATSTLDARYRVLINVAVAFLFVSSSSIVGTK